MSDEQGRDLSALAGVASAVGALAPPVTIATSLMLYFGWARTAEQARFMGVDVSLFGYSTQDYVLRSIRTLYIPLLVVAAAVLCWLAVHHRVLKVLETRRRGLRVAGRALFATGLAALAAVVVVATVQRAFLPLVVPLVLAVGTVVAAYGAWLTRVTGDAKAPAPPWHNALRKLMVGSMITLALFWELSLYAGVTGRGYADELAATVHTLPRATAYSGESLGIEAPNVVEERLDTGRHRTTGLRLLVRSGGRVFLLHDRWNPVNGRVVVLPDNETVRWQFSR
ncbi:hypothetical protein GCM10010492_05060 [Saccharothrix mutabilis subsp. mutabilis]|uniref:Uncharacterized protein n=1 Tax=Saccharothrix mutabilis subsp. mutabilis TaxID=66855 RepID=A0ABN0T2B3_9PSEU